MEKDYLTGCYSRGSLYPFLEKMICEANAHNQILSVALIDLDKFKRFNDKFGHLFGDNILKYASSTLRLTLGAEIPIFRYGGDEFVVVFIGKAKKEVVQLTRLCNYNVKNRRFLYKADLYRMTISCGIASLPDDGKTEEELFNKADKAMYFSKHYGGNLSTEASKIRYLKLRNALLVFASACILFASLFIINTYIYRGSVNDIIARIRNLRITAEPRRFAAVTLKNGSIIKGYILDETSEIVVMTFELKRRNANTFTLKKSEITEMKYGVKQL